MKNKAVLESPVELHLLVNCDWRAHSRSSIGFASDPTRPWHSASHYFPQIIICTCNFVGERNGLLLIPALLRTFRGGRWVSKAWGMSMYSHSSSGNRVSLPWNPDHNLFKYGRESTLRASQFPRHHIIWASLFLMLSIFFFFFLKVSYFLDVFLRNVGRRGICSVKFLLFV